MASQDFTAAQVLTAAQMDKLVNAVDGYSTTATAAGTTVLTVDSNYQQVFTGATTQTVTLPVASTMGGLGQRFRIINDSTGVVTVNSSGGNLIYAIPAGVTVDFIAILLTGTTAASWLADYPTAASSSLTSQSATLSADVTMTSANVFYDGVSITLAAGTWLIIATVLVFDSGGFGGEAGAKLWDGTTVSASAMFRPNVASASGEMTLSAIVAPVGSTTYKMSAVSTQASWVIKAAQLSNGSGNNAGRISAVKIA